MKIKIELGKRLRKSLRELPKHIIANLLDWVEEVEAKGLEEIRRLPGYHDEPLKGPWFGYRSIRLSRSYRAIYKEKEAEIKIIVVVEVNKHEY